MPGVAEAIVVTYLAGAVGLGPVVFWGVHRHDPSRPRVAAALGAVAGAAWPLVLFGLGQCLVIVAALSATGYVARSRVHRGPPDRTDFAKPPVPSNA